MSRHRHFLFAFALGLLATALAPYGPMGSLLRILTGAVVFFASYLGLMWLFTHDLPPDGLRARAAAGDEGLALILILAVAVIAVSITAIILVLNGPGGGSMMARIVALGSIPLGWATLHTLAAFHYAHLYYRPDANGEGGLSFPGTAEPDPWDFLYFAFGLGMTAQVADVCATDGQFRRAILLHQVGAFFYNTVILALAVNAALTARG